MRSEVPLGKNSMRTSPCAPPGRHPRTAARTPAAIRRSSTTRTKIVESTSSASDHPEADGQAPAGGR
jgi:hypothetical protein